MLTFEGGREGGEEGGMPIREREGYQEEEMNFLDEPDRETARASQERSKATKKREKRRRGKQKGEERSKGSVTKKVVKMSR